MSWPYKQCDHYLSEPTEQDVAEGRTTCDRPENPAGECAEVFCPFGRPICTKIPEDLPDQERIEDGYTER